MKDLNCSVIDNCLVQQRERAEKLEAEAKGGAQPTTPMKRRLGTTAMRTAMESPKAKQRKLAAPSVTLFSSIYT